MKLFISLLLLIICSTAIAQKGEIKDLEGYIDFGELSSVYGEPKVRINIGEKLLGFVGLIAKNEDEDAAELLRKLKAVRVEVYELNKDSGPAVNMLKEISEKLQSKGWEAVVTVQEKEEQVRIFVKISQDVIDGLVVMAVDDGGEGVFINIIGEIEPEQVGKVTRALDIDLDI